jgi:HSP20 family protein
VWDLSYAPTEKLIPATPRSRRPRPAPTLPIIWSLRSGSPGGRAIAIQVSVDDGMITIKGERKQHKEDKSEKFHRMESFYGSFERRFSLPENVNADAVHCESKDGILTIHIPKTAESPKHKAKQITIQ